MTPPPPRRLVVAGAGLAAARTVASLRARGFDGHVTVLGAEGTPPYDRPPLSKHLLDRTEPAWLADEVGADLVALADVTHLDRPAHGLTVRADGVQVATAAGDLDADALVVATGARAVLPAGWEGARTLHTAADAEGLRASLTSGARLVVVGAGWIGAEVAGVAAAAGVDVTVVEARSPLSGALGAVGRLTEPWYERAGVRLVTGTPVVEVRGDGVRTRDEHLRADVVLVAVGARPATAWVGAALPREPDGSLRVDEHLAVVGAPPHVRAVGDVALRRSPRHGWVPGGHWDGALRGPEHLVAALLGEPSDPPADDVPYVFSTQLGHELALLGLPEGEDVVLRGDPRTGPWAALWFRGDALAAILTVDRPRDVGAARRLLAGTALPVLDRAVAADPDRALRDAAR